jgi:Tol biopolymer transport system component
MPSLASNGNIWLISMKTGAISRVTTSPGWDYTPVWSHDGSEIFYSSSSTDGRSDLAARSSGAIGEGRVILRNPSPGITVFIGDTSPDGHYLVYASQEDL